MIKYENSWNNSNLSYCIFLYGTKKPNITFIVVGEIF